MRQAYDRGITKQTMSRYQAHGEWELYKAQIQEFHKSEDVRLGRKLCLPSSNLQYAMSPTRELYKLFVNGIHSDMTENGLRHVFSNYGNPISIKLFRTNNNLHQPIAFVEFESQYEADNAIVALDGKPPLNWEVVYANRRLGEKLLHGEQDLVSLAVATVVRRQTDLVQGIGAGMKPSCFGQSPCSFETDSSSGIMHRRSVSPDMHLQYRFCHVCGKSASFVCTVCKIRYCSLGCQSRDWPTHQPICKPLPALLQEIPHGGVSLKGVVSKPFHGYPDISSPLPQTERPSIATRDDQSDSNNYSAHFQNNGTFEVTSPDLYLIKSTHPLDRAEISLAPTAEVSVAVHRNQDGRQERTNSVAAVNMVDAIKSLSINKEYGRPESNWHSIDQQPSSQPCPPSSNWKRDETYHAETSQSNHVTSKNYLKNDFAQNHSPVVSNKPECDFESSPVITSRSFRSGNHSPNTAPESPSYELSQTRSSEAIKIYAKKFISTQLKQQLDDPNEVNVCSAKSPDEFYVQFYRYRKLLEEIMASVTTSATNSDPLVNPVEGLPCLAIFPEDRCWYRAEILKIMPDGIGIRYVDFGNTILMPNNSEHLRMMEQSLAQHPFCAVKVKLANVLPVSGITWNSFVKKKFKELVENKPFLMYFVKMDADVMCVRLKNPDGSDCLSPLIEEKLIKKAMVEVSDELDQISPAVEIPLQTPSRETVTDVLKASVVCSQVLEENVAFESNDRLENTEKEIVSCLPTTLTEKNMPLSEAKCVETCDRKESYINKNGSALYKIKENLQELSENNISEVSISQIEVETDGSNPASLPSEGKISEDSTSDEFLYDDGPFLDLPEKGSFQALIIKAEDPQFIILRVENSEISMKLTKLQEEIALHANSIACDYHPKLNEVCIARFPGGRWYRAVCLNVILDRQSTGTRYLCNQVDFGDMCILDASKIRRAKKWMIDLLPYLAQHAILEGTDSMEQMEPKLVERFVKILPENSIVDVNVVNRVDTSYVVRIPKVNATLSFERLV
ncbi:hypothetical protein GHT06_013579 [Daphnia sinensis]|uniref:Tudor domain-containing protein 1 n=1 Tax=Daphnia sinensis TaxID=1820382 RepID=A0AAD5PX50_9CRUS|nr:hypothetical protein GHT06_013579 [Daphnia sinensis]